MKSVADALARELAEQVKAMSIDERLALVARLAEDDLGAFQAATGLPRERALGRLSARRHVGRRPSVAASWDDPGDE